VASPGEQVRPYTGFGISAEERDKVFQRFYRRNPQVGDAGLGLAIVGEP
jgi:two-component system sensor histidine kinase TctE